MTTSDLQAAERAYQRARRADRQGASVKRKAAVRAALEAGWTHRAVAEAMGKSTGWVGQLLTVKAPQAPSSDLLPTDADGRIVGPYTTPQLTRHYRAEADGLRAQRLASTPDASADLAQQLARVDAVLSSGRGPQTYAAKRRAEIMQQIANTTAPQQDRPKAIDRFRKAQA